ncbi:hypothetical protein KAR91_51880 [Candidatus Pacearchaeota archaeon]|nr:hypothetical protein [Candidatus Pacearchaeota archaeon]
MPDLSEISEADLAGMSDEELIALTGGMVEIAEEDRKINQLQYYEPVSAKAMRFHESTAHVIGVGGGNGSGKSETTLVDLVSCATGCFPDHIAHLADQKFKGPINTRIVLESLTAVLHPVFVPKLQWFSWTGQKPMGGEQGHWGWIPQDFLIDGDFSKSWSEKLRTLKVCCRDPHNRDNILGYSRIQFMSHDNDPEDFASGDYDYVMLDEPPTYAIYRENQARTMRVDGKIVLAMTWPDDPAIPVDWVFDEVYERAKDGSDIEWYEFFTTENKHLNQKSIAAQMDKWDDETKAVRIYGRPIRFSNLIHPDFTAEDRVWDFRKGKQVLELEDEQTQKYYNHVVEFDHNIHTPVVFLLDPHPRKPHMFMWVAVDPYDDWWVVVDGECDGEPEDLRNQIYEMERTYGLRSSLRLIDPNMGKSPMGKRRGDCWQEEFSNCGLHMDLADDSDVGRSRINGRLKPDRDTMRPRIHIHPRCENTIHQLKRYAWEDYKKSQERDLKQKPRDKNDDYPTLLKYLANYDPDYRFLRQGAPVIGRGKRKGAYS